jgi:uncharacterized protein YndB with AHSA1/START domain
MTDRCTITFERRYDASPAEVWAALTEPERLARWLAPAEIGDTVRIDFGNDVVTGRVLVRDEPRVLEYEWRFAGEDESVVRFELLADDEGTLLRLEHRRLGPEHALGYSAGWHAYLDDLLTGPRSPWEERFAELLPLYRSGSLSATASTWASDVPRARAMRS